MMSTFGFIFLLIAIWQLIITWKTFTNLRVAGGKNTSPFIMLALSNSLLFAVVFFVVGIGCIFLNGRF